MTHGVMVGMILNFRDKATALVWNGSAIRALPLDVQHAARRKLRMLNNAATLADLLTPPGNNTAFVSTINGAFVLSGVTAIVRTLKLRTTIKVAL